MQRNTEQIEQIELTRLVPYARNSRTHSDEQVASAVRDKVLRKE